LNASWTARLVISLKLTRTTRWTRALLVLGAAVAEFPGQVPCNRFALTVRVRSQVDCVGALGKLLQPGQNLFFSGDNLVFSLKIIFNVNTKIALRQILHMTQ